MAENRTYQLNNNQQQRQQKGASLGGREETNLMLNLKAEVQSLKTTFNKTTWQDQQIGAILYTYSERNLINGLKLVKRGFSVFPEVDVEASDPIITIIWLLPVIRYLWSWEMTLCHPCSSETNCLNLCQLPACRWFSFPDVNTKRSDSKLVAILLVLALILPFWFRLQICQKYI